MQRLSSLLGITTKPVPKPQRSEVKDIDYFISDIRNCKDLDSSSYISAVSNFSNYILFQYKQYTNSNEYSLFLNELFSKVSLRHLEENTELYIILVSIIIKLDIGDKVTIASRIARDIGTIENPMRLHFFKLLREIITYLIHILGTSTQLIFQPLFQKVWKWTMTPDKEKVIAGFRLFALLYELFNNLMENYRSTVQSLIIFSFQYQYTELDQVITDILSTTYAKEDILNPFDASAVINKIMMHLTNPMFSYYRSSVHCAEEIINNKPELILNFKFKSLFEPLKYLQSKEEEQYMAAMHLLPFIARTTPDLFNEEALNKIFKTISPWTKKRTEPRLRNAALYALGKIICLKKGGSLHIQEQVEAIIQNIKELNNSSECFYFLSSALISQFLSMNSFLDIAFTSIFNDKLTIKALQRLFLFLPESKEEVCKKYIQKANELLESNNNVPPFICFILSSFVKIEIPAELLTNYIMSYSNYTKCDCISVRKKTADLILYYQKFFSRKQIDQLLLSIATTDFCDDIRRRVITEMNKDTSCFEFSSILISLVYDRLNEVSYGALQFLLKYTKSEHADKAMKIITDIFNELMSQLEEAQIPYRTSQLFLIIAEESKTNEAISSFMKENAEEIAKRLLIRKKKLTSASLLLLAFVIESVEIDDEALDVLVSNVDSGLEPHSSAQSIEASTNLLVAALKNTKLSTLVYSKYIHIVYHLIEASSRPSAEGARENILTALSLIGPIPLNIRKKETQMNNMPLAKYLVETYEIKPLIMLEKATLNVVLTLILEVLSNDNMEAIHTVAIESLLSVMKANRNMPEENQRKIIQQLSVLLKSKNALTVTTLFNNIPTLLTVLEENFTPLIELFVQDMIEMWDKIGASLSIRTCEWMIKALPMQFKLYMHQICTHFVSQLSASNLRDTRSIIDAFVTFGDHMREESKYVIPKLLSCIAEISDNEIICEDFIDRLHLIFFHCETDKFYPDMVKYLSEVVKNHPRLMTQCVNLFVQAGFHMGKSFLMCIPELSKHFKLDSSQLMIDLIDYMKSNKPASDTLLIYITQKQQYKPLLKAKSTPRITSFGDTKQKAYLPPSDADDSSWIGWSQDFIDFVIHESTSKTIQACSLIADKHPYVKEILAPLAFIFYYLDDANNEMAFRIIRSVIISDNVPKYVLKTFLVTIELLEVLEIDSKLKIEDITKAAMRADMNSLALRYAEKQFMTNCMSSVELLISLNTQLNLPLAAQSVLKQASLMRMKVDEAAAAEQTGLWELANEIYSKKIEAGEKQYIVKKLMCLDKLGKFTEMMNGKDEYKATALLHLSENESFLKIVPSLGNSERAQVLQMIGCLMKHEGDIEQISHRVLYQLSKNVFPLVSEDYEKSLPIISNVSLVRTLNEAFNCKELLNDRENNKVKIEKLKNIWKVRFSNFYDNPRELHNFICVFHQIMEPSEFTEEIEKCAYLSINQSMFEITENCIHLMEESGQSVRTDLIRSHLLKAKGQTNDAIATLSNISNNESVAKEERAKAELAIGCWMREEHKSKEAAEHTRRAIEFSQNMENAHYQWALSNYHCWMETKEKTYLNNSFKGLMSALALSKSRSLIYTLKILTTLFNSPDKEILSCFRENITKIPEYAWVDIIPQIIARITTNNDELRRIIIDLLVAVGKQYPYVVLLATMPLLDSDGTRKEAIDEIYSKIRQTHAQLSSTLQTFSNQLVRIAVSWMEECITVFDKLTSAEEEDIDKPMMKLLNKVTETPTSFLEVSFARKHANEIESLKQVVEIYANDRTLLNKSNLWRCVAHLYDQIKADVKTFNSFELSDASPWLAQGPFDILVPGRYNILNYDTKIQSITQTIPIIISKQRPRKLEMTGTDGITYCFLLKGHEDTRLDERVMQLFKFMNSIVPQNEKLAVTTYDVTPLTKSVGLIGWVPGCSTMFDIVRKYREMHGIPVELEYQTATKGVQDYDALNPEKKLIAFRDGLKATQGDDMKVILYKFSADTNDWIERRLTYTASLASTSMYGYIMGLGDRHLANIMVDKVTAKLVHIDFGDCFEVAQHRKRFPEKVQFRLTRMLVNAMEPCGAEGTFHALCVKVMESLGEHSQQISGLLEAFVYDPLQQWDNDGEASSIVQRITDKLTGKEFASTEEQVTKLINQATDKRNLSQMYRGWYPWW